MNQGCAFFIATSGGKGHIAQQFKMLAQILAQRGHRVVVLLDGRRLSEISYTTNPSIYTWPSARPTTFKDTLFLYRLVQLYKPDCLISNFGASNTMLLVGALMRVPKRIDWYHTISTAFDLETTSIPWKDHLMRLRKRLILKMATNVVSVSNACCVDSQRVYGVAGEKCAVFYNSLADPLHECDNNSLPNTEMHRKRVVCVGRFAHIKGQDILIRAITILKEYIPNVDVEFLGDGATRETCVKLADELGVSSNCQFLGHASIESVLSRLAHAQVAVIPSRAEAFGMVIVEALSVGTPVIATNVGGIGELIRDSVDGYLVPPESPAAIAEKLKLILTDDELRINLGKNAREHFLSTFEQKKVLNELADWLERIVERT